MKNQKISRLIISFCLFSLLILSSCTNQLPSRFEQAQQESTAAGNKNTAVEKNAVKGATFNQFFPVSSGDYERVFTQEKSGFVQAKLKQNGQDLATLAIFDTISNPSAKEDFKDATDKISGFPVVEKGSNNTAVLVSDRYQVSVKSANSNFTAEQRKEWLGKFDLDNLAQLK
jgi:Cu/Zn superoxide dismutase